MEWMVIENVFIQLCFNQNLGHSFTQKMIFELKVALIHLHLYLSQCIFV